MTTIAQVKEVIKPLLERNSDLALVGREIYIKPVHHFARVVLIDRMLDPDLFRPQWTVAHLFEARHFLPLSWGAWLQNARSNTPGIWSVRDPDLSAAMVEAIETHALPVLRGIVSLDEYLALVSGHFFRHHLFDWPEVKIIVDVARGDLVAARALRDTHIEQWGDDPEYDE
ncbi:hypothetical protein [Rhodoplanes sp. SY1]|uniref:hypothetical protein n=1 Tax=Rhodoplanes sp. SY1 TaxID=3166646 RepID=UPI0038B50B87